MSSSKFWHIHNLTKEMWVWCQTRDIWVFPSYIFSKQNIIADSEWGSLILKLNIHCVIKLS